MYLTHEPSLLTEVTRLGRLTLGDALKYFCVVHKREIYVFGLVIFIFNFSHVMSQFTFLVQ